MRPVVIKIFKELWNEATSDGQRNAAKKFQKLCQEVKTWNETQIREYTDMVKAKCEYFSDLVAAIFVAEVKILSSIKARKNPPKVNVEVPNNDLFVHSVILKMAERLYWEPNVIAIADDYVRGEEVGKRLFEAVKKTVYRMCPRKAVLKANIGSDVIEDVNGEDEEAPDEVPDIGAFSKEASNREEDQSEQQVDPATTTDADEAEENEEPEESTPPGEDIKTIGQPVPGDEEEESLFPGASANGNYDA